MSDESWSEGGEAAAERQGGGRKDADLSLATNNICFFGLVRLSVIPRDVISYNLQVFLIFCAFLQLTGVSKRTVAHIHTSEQLSSGHEHLHWSVQGPNASLGGRAGQKFCQLLLFHFPWIHRCQLEYCIPNLYTSVTASLRINSLYCNITEKKK